jgi:hypothetical protein
MLLSDVVTNHASLLINTAFANQAPIPTHLEPWLLLSLDTLSAPHSSNVYRHLSRISLERGDIQSAADYWQKDDLPVQDALAFGHKFFFQQEFLQALAWYELATIIEPDNAQVWLGVGLVCQNGFWDIIPCQQFLQFNQMNYLLNTDLMLGDSGWHTTHREIAEHTIETCPNLAQDCLKIEIIEKSFELRGNLELTLSENNCIIIKPKC